MQLSRLFQTRYFWVLPIAYLFLAVFLLRSNVWYVYLAAGVLVLVTTLVHVEDKKAKSELRLARWLAVLGAIGLSAAFILSIEKVELLTNPEHVASCSLSPIVACSPVIGSWQASAFGIPNSFIGIFAYGAVLAAAITIGAGAITLHKNWWRTLLGGMVFGSIFAGWLFYQGVYAIGTLCLYCTLVWLVTFAMLWLVTAYCIEKKHINLGVKANNLLSKPFILITATYSVIFILLFLRWADYWLSLFR